MKYKNLSWYRDKTMIIFDELYIDDLYYGSDIISIKTDIGQKLRDYIIQNDLVLPIVLDNQVTFDSENTRANIKEFINQKLTKIANEKNYDTITSICSYMNSKIQEYREEAEKFIEYRDSVWQIVNEYLNKTDFPSIDEVSKLIPEFKW